MACITGSTSVNILSTPLPHISPALTTFTKTRELNVHAGAGIHFTMHLLSATWRRPRYAPASPPPPLRLLLKGCWLHILYGPSHLDCRGHFTPPARDEQHSRPRTRRVMFGRTNVSSITGDGAGEQHATARLRNDASSSATGGMGAHLGSDGRQNGRATSHATPVARWATLEGRRTGDATHLPATACCPGARGSRLGLHLTHLALTLQPHGFLCHLYTFWSQCRKHCLSPLATGRRIRLLCSVWLLPAAG